MGEDQGGSGWRDLTELTQAETAKIAADRFSHELGYDFVQYCPIFQTDNGKRLAFHLIHASDHPEAPELMNRAYLKVVGDIAGTPTDSQGCLF